jgi:hypothetical protein
MIGRAEFAYAQARLQARHGLRPSEATWRLLEASKDLGHYLQAADTTPFRPWIRHLSAGMDSHAIERSIRADWRGYVAEVGAWQPARWRPALRWTAALVDLPALAHLLRARPVQPWMRDDPALGPVALDDPTARRAALVRSAFAPIAVGWQQGLGVADGWVAHWQRLWPADDSKARLARDRLAALVGRHLTAMAGGTLDGGRLRAELDAALTRLFRRQVQDPIAAYCHLGLVALDLERLRGDLVRRCLFPPPREAGA